MGFFGKRSNSFRFIRSTASSLSKRRSVRGRPSSPSGTMVSYGVSSGADVEKKCNLLGKFISDTDEREIYTSTVKRNMALYLNSAEKVRLKVGRNALTITDRTIWHNKLDRIPISLIIDAHIDSESPKICYFVNESINKQYQVLVFLCKSNDDALKLVSNCPKRSAALGIYSYSTPHNPIEIEAASDYNHMLSPYTTENHRSPKINSWTSAQHSNDRVVCSPGDNTYYGSSSRGKKHTVNFKAAVQQYDSDSSMSKNRGTIQRNEDGIARIVVGGNDSYLQSNEDFNKTSGLTLVGASQGTIERKKGHLNTDTLDRKTPNASKNYNDGSLRRIHSPKSPIRQNGDGSNSPYSYGERNPTTSQQRKTQLGQSPETERRLVVENHLTDQTNFDIRHGVTKLQADGYGSQKRRKGHYKSIQEYEASQRSNGGLGKSSNSLTPVFGSENTAPQQNMTLVLNGNQYSIKNDNSLQRRGKSPGKQLAWQGSATPNAVRIAQNGNFGNSQDWREHRGGKTGGESRVVISPNQMDIQPQQMSNHLQHYPGHHVQPKYDVRNFGEGDNFLRNEKLEVDDDHKFYRQHGQRMKETKDGNQRLYLDQRLAETNDLIGNQMVKGQHAQKVQSGETVGANHRSRFHSEVRVSHQVSQPAGTNATAGPLAFPIDGNIVNQSRFGRQNSRPVKVTTHQWPAITQFNQNPLQTAPNMPRMHFSEEMNFTPAGFGMGPGHPGVQRFFAPPLNPRPEIIHPGFQRFFESIKNFGPHQSMNPLTDASSSGNDDRQLAIEDSTTKQLVPKIETPSDNISESSSIRSSASAYWPPELKFQPSAGETTNKHNKPMMVLRRKSPNDGHERHHQLRIIN